MNFNEYQILSKHTIEKNTEKRRLKDNCMLGMIGEFGEVADILKKVLFHGHSQEEHEEELKKEIGDVYWYISTLCTANEFEFDFDNGEVEITEKNSYTLLISCFKLLNDVIGDDENKEKLEKFENTLRKLLEIQGFEVSGVLEMNVNKLRKRYPNGFNSSDSINRS